MLHWWGFSPAHYQRERERERKKNRQKKKTIKLNQLGTTLSNKLMVSLTGVFGEVLWLRDSNSVSKCVLIHNIFCNQRFQNASQRGL